MNLQKYTKAELITKLKDIKNNPETNYNLLTYLYLIKSFILKITFLTIIIRIFKRFSILRRIWLIINTVVMSIFGISMLDLYGLSFISEFWVEISTITGNIVNYLSSTKFYTYLIGILGLKIETPTKIESMRTIDPSPTKLSKEIEGKHKLSEWFNKPEKIEETPFYQNRTFIYSTIFVVSCLSYYYFGTEIKINLITMWDLLRGRRPGDTPPTNPPTNPNPDSTNANPDSTNANPDSTGLFNPIASLFGLNKNKGKGKVSLKDLVENASDLTEDEAFEFASSSKDPLFVDLSNPSESKPTLTSPSLDDLNSKVEDSWSKSRGNSPDSTSSSSTIKPSKLPSTNISENTNINTTSTNVFKHDEIPKSMIESSVEKLDNLYNHKGKVTSFLSKQIVIKNVTETNWTKNVDPLILDKMNSIENIFNSEEELTREMANQLVDNLSIITKAYDSLAETYTELPENLAPKKVVLIKNMAFHMRSWLKDYHKLVFPTHNIILNEGSKLDSPKFISSSIFEDD